ncbi:hypothetical protein [Bacillus ndiopicus]|uniref:hypothetical protein n=1 Tax=Bacillus ndiopicus TaxID=1347368 RepID=UPI0005A84308|nr:hypothetical protein [Bacillus ndiopicus]
MRQNKLLYLGIVLSVLLLNFSTNIRIASADFSNNINYESNGEIIIKYSAPDMDWTNATEQQKYILTKIGWEIENDIPVLYRKTSDILKNNDHNPSLMNIQNAHHEEQGMVLSVNNKVQRSFDGTFYVDEKYDEAYIEINGFNHKINAKKILTGYFKQ